jgi:hypothetical protein
MDSYCYCYFGELRNNAKNGTGFEFIIKSDNHPEKEITEQ